MGRVGAPLLEPSTPGILFSSSYGKESNIKPPGSDLQGVLYFKCVSYRGGTLF